MKKKKLLKISDVARLTGLSVNGIRYYERQGQQIEDEISEKRVILDAIENRIRQMNEIKLQYGRCRLAEGPAYYMKAEIPWNNGTFFAPMDLTEGKRFYARCGPAVAPAVLIPAEQLSKRQVEGGVCVGLGVLASALSDQLRNDLSQDPLVRYFPPQICIYTVILIGEDHPWQEILSPVFDYAAQYKLNFSGDAYTYRIAAIEEKPESSTGFYAQAWFPVTQAEGEPIQGEA